MSDNISKLENRIKVLTDSNEELVDSLKHVRDIAIETRTPLAGIANLYSKVAVAGKRFNIAQYQVGSFTSSVAKAMAVSGASVQEINSIVIQLGQGLASNRLGGEELRAVLEGSYTLSSQIAKGSGIAFENLRKVAEKGGLTYKTVVNAILKQTDEIDAKFAKLGVTYGQAFTVIGTAINTAFDQLGKSISMGDTTLPAYFAELGEKLYAFSTEIEFFIAKTRFFFRTLSIDLQLFITKLTGFRFSFGVFDPLLDKFQQVKDGVYELKNAFFSGNFDKMAKASDALSESTVGLIEAFNTNISSKGIISS